MIRELKPAWRIKKGLHHPLLAIDCENNPDTGAFICAGIYGEVKHRTSTRIDGKPKVKYTTLPIEKYVTSLTEFEEFLMSLKPNSCLLVFFNLSYDKIYLNNIINHASVLRNGNRVITFKLYNRIKAIDLSNHVEAGDSLDDWIKHLNMTEKYGIKKAELSDHYNRVMNDAKATFYLGTFLEDFYYYECGISLKVTVGAAALALFTQKFFKDHWFRDNDFISNFERNAYYGGRVELFKRGMQKTFNYDVNSMYLSIMKNNLIPDVSTAKYIENGKNWKEYINKYLGIFHCKVETPSNLYIAVLPYRIDGKLKFPRGSFEGSWTNIELLEAIKAGYKIIKVYDFIYYHQSKYYFSDFASFVWAKRKEYKAKNNKGMNKQIKKIGNTLYGKFAQRNSQDYFGKIADCPEIPPICQFYQVNGETWILTKGDLIPAKFEFPAISAFITSYARLKLYHAMIENEDALVYCDTDSIKLNSEASNISVGGDLGEWAFEGITEAEFYRPKYYGDKCKGVPKRAELIETTKDYKAFKFTKPLREREAVKRGLIPNTWHEVIKILTFLDDKRYWNNNISSPVNLINGIDNNDAAYKKWLEKRYAPKYRYGDYTNIDKVSPADEWAVKEDNLTIRRRGEAIYQRHKI